MASEEIVFGRYRVVRPLRGVGINRVYLAEDTRLANRPCALAEMIDNIANLDVRRQAVRAFQREADILVSLSHEHIVRVYDRFSDQNRHYLVMEYIDGETLEERLARAGSRLDQAMVADCTLQILDALEYLHGLSPPVIYRDLKASNVIVTSQGRVKLIDFGIGRFFRPETTATKFGSPGYAPPEQYKGHLEPASDLYALGATMHYLLTGRDPASEPPFTFPPVEQLRPDLDRRMADLVNEALSYDVSQRISSAREFKRRLARIRAGSIEVSSDGTQPLAQQAVYPHLRPGGSRRWEMGRSQDSAPRVQTDYSLVASAENTVLCSDCGEAIPEDSRFCLYCASELRIAIGPGAKSPTKRSWLAAAAVLVVVVGGIGLAAANVYNVWSAQRALGLQSFVENLPWKRAARLEAAKRHPLKLEGFSIALANADGAPATPPSTSFKDSELQATKTLTWNASFASQLLDLASGTESVEARLFNTSGAQISSSNSSRFVSANDRSVQFSGTLSLPPFGVTVGKYHVRFFVGDQSLGEETVSVTPDTSLTRPTLPRKHHIAFSLPHTNQPRPPKTPYHIVIDKDFNQNAATAMSDRIRSLGYPVDIQKVDTDDGSDVYQLLVGAYSSADEAYSAQEEFQRRYDERFEK